MNSGKYRIEGYINVAGDPEGQLVNIETGIPIPDEEPVFILRARDAFAIQTLEHYQELADTEPFASDVDRCMKAFVDWQSTNPNKVKEPD
jgi:hypothetical protein